MHFIKYNYLHPDARYIRETVFVEEQGFKEEFDSVDDEATHILMYDGNKAVATCRALPMDQEGEYLLGRIAVLSEYRGQMLGASLMEEAERYILELGGVSIVLHAQKRASGFYEYCGYNRFGEEDLDEGCPHIWMRKRLG